MSKTTQVASRSKSSRNQALCSSYGRKCFNDVLWPMHLLYIRAEHFSSGPGVLAASVPAFRRAISHPSSLWRDEPRSANHVQPVHRYIVSLHTSSICNRDGSAPALPRDVCSDCGCVGLQLLITPPQLDGDSSKCCLDSNRTLVDSALRWCSQELRPPLLEPRGPLPAVNCSDAVLWTRRAPWPAQARVCWPQRLR
jgi:hypothetical protein